MKLAGAGSWPSRLRLSSIGRKLGVVFLVILLAAVANIIVVKDMVRHLNNLTSTAIVGNQLRTLSQRAAFETLNIALGLRLDLGEVELRIRQFDQAAQAMLHGGEAFGLHIEPLDKLHNEALLRMRDSWLNYRFLVETVLASRSIEIDSAGDPQRGIPFIDPLARAAEHLLDTNGVLLDSIDREAQATHKRAMLWLYGLLLANVLILLVAFWYVRRKIVLPLRELSNQCHALAGGNYNVRVSHDSLDEIGGLAEALNVSAARIGSLITRIDQDRQELRQAEAMFRGLAENSMVGVYVLRDGHFLYVNSRMAEIFQYERSEILSLPGLNALLSDDDLERLEGGHAGEDGTPQLAMRIECRGQRRDGLRLDLEIFGSQMVLDGERLTIGVVLDITERKEAEAFSRMTLMVYQNSSEAMVVTDAEGIVVDVNPAFSAITGYSASDVVERKLNILSSGRQNRSFYQEMWQELERTGKWQGDIWNRRKDGEEYAERLSISTSYNSDGTVRYRIGLFSDVTRQKRSEAFIWRQANYDHLTGLPNRQLFRDRLQRAIVRSDRSGLPLALIFLDLDLFKDVNDTLGHGMGDELLKQVATRLAGCVRATDTVARLGGDEFTIVLGELHDSSVVERICQQTLRTLVQPYRLGEDVATISASLGVTFYPRDGTDIEALLKNADLAMYAAKEKGRSQYTYFDASMQRAAQARRQLSRDFINALEQNQFVLHYQPIVGLQGQGIRKAEAVIRWQHPTLGLIGPGEFISYAEDSGIIVRLGDWVFREAARQVAEWRAQYGVDMQVSINVSPMQFLPDGLDHDAWLKHLSDLGLTGQCLVVEITERLLMDVSQTVTSKLLAFRDAGIQVALDDFGTGYSSLSYLKKFDIDYIKIDQSFVANLGPETDDMALCEAIIVMAHKLGMMVVAEGVETSSQRDLLVAADCDYGQGYLFCRPVPAGEFARFIERGM